jgi:hypothetical protein
MGSRGGLVDTFYTPANDRHRFSALEFMKVLPWDINLSKDASQKPPPDILSFVYWKYGAASVGVLPHCMAAALTCQDKAKLQQTARNFPGG